MRAKYGASLTRFEKSAGDFATAADIEAEKAILDVLRSARPDDAVTGEESGRTGSSAAERMWLVDPLCGTLNYAVRSMLVAVNVALRTGSEITVAASADPFADEVFWTDGTRAYVRRDGVDEQLTPSAESRLVDVNLDPPFPNAPRFRAVRLLADTGFVERFLPAWSPPPWRWPGWQPAGEPRTSPMATCGTACTSPAGSPCVRPQDAW